MEKSADHFEQQEFGKKVLAAIPHIIPYVKHRLYRAESAGIIPKNMYRTNGVIDDAIVLLYEEPNVRELDKNELKLRLFAKADHTLDELYKKESFHKDSMSTSGILENELAMLEEKFTVDGDEDLIMNEELDDISYHQADFKKSNFVYEDTEQNIIQALGLEDLHQKSDTEKRLVIHKIYQWLPMNTSNILDLYMFGKMEINEIAKIKRIETTRVERILNEVRKSFRKNLV